MATQWRFSYCKGSVITMESLGTRLKTTYDIPRQPYIKVSLRFLTHEKIWLSSQHILFDFPTQSSPLCTFPKSSHTHLRDLYTHISFNNLHSLSYLRDSRFYVACWSVCDCDQDFDQWGACFDCSFLKVLIAWFSVVQRLNCSILLIYGSEVTLVPWLALKKELWTLSLIWS